MINIIISAKGCRKWGLNHIIDYLHYDHTIICIKQNQSNVPLATSGHCSHFTHSLICMWHQTSSSWSNKYIFFTVDEWWLGSECLIRVRNLLIETNSMCLMNNWTQWNLIIYSDPVAYATWHLSSSLRSQEQQLLLSAPRLFYRPSSLNRHPS